jgi:hypothetical protein
MIIKTAELWRIQGEFFLLSHVQGRKNSIRERRTGRK